jgi:hypothetical protein
MGEYLCLEEIGQGGNGVVYRARDLRLGRDVAVKVLRAGATSETEARLRFEREAASAARLEHPNIVPIYEFHPEAERPWFAMRWIRRGNLAARLRESVPTPGRVARWMSVLAEAIQHAHSRGVLHRDLKPGNVLIDELDAPHVADFGLARWAGGPGLVDEPSTLTAEGVPQGSANYMAPEQARGRSSEIGPAVDVHGLGAVLYHCLVGRPPFVANSLAEVLRQVEDWDPVPPRQLVPSVPRDLETICLKCLEKEPRRRYPSAQALHDDLERFLRDEPIRARPAGRAERTYRFFRRRPVVGALVVALAASVLVGAGSTFWHLKALERSNRALLQGRSRDALELANADGELGRTATALQRLVGAIREDRGNAGLQFRLADFLERRTWALPRRVLGQETAGVMGARVRFAPDGHRLVCVSSPVAGATEPAPGQSVTVWDVRTGRREAGPWSFDGAPVSQVVFHPDGQQVRIVDESGRAHVFTVDGRPVVGSETGFPPLPGVFLLPTPLAAAGFTNPAAASVDQRFWISRRPWASTFQDTVWDGVAGRPLFELPGGEEVRARGCGRVPGTI